MKDLDIYLINHAGTWSLVRPNDKLDAALAELEQKGVRLIDTEPRTGIRNSRVAFCHPRSTGSVLTEIVEPAEGH